MARRLATVRVLRRYQAPPGRVFDAWLDPETAGHWLFATASRPMASVAIDARVDGAFLFVERRDGEDVEYAGAYVEISPPRRLVFALAATERAMHRGRVTIEITPVKGGCELGLTHEGVAAGEASRTEGRWTGILYGLNVALGDGDRKPAKQKEPLQARASRRSTLSNSAPAERL